MSIEVKVEAARGLIREILAQTGAVCVTSSFQVECMALVDLVTAERADAPILFLDTGYHFPETYAYRDEMAERMKLNLKNLVPQLTVIQQEREFGILYQNAPDRCCAMRKVEPLFAGLAPYDTWFTALRRDQSPTRSNLQEVDTFRLPAGKELRKISPLAGWTAADVWAYLKLRGIPPLPLYDQGYTSIGCAPCTQPPPDPDNPRSGRWAGQKLECGIHISS